jgi:RNA polymerase sigma factor (sigma-70 family)
MATGLLSGVVPHLRRAALLHEGAGVTDGQLLERYLGSRDETAFEALVRRHGPMVLGVGRRILGNEHDAEDAFQATFLVLARRADGIRPRDRVGNWLYGVAYRTALKAKVLARRRRAREKRAAERPRPAARDEAPWSDLRPLLDGAVNRLPDKYRAAVVLCDLEGKTRKEAARHLGWPEGTVSTRLAKARAMLGRQLSRYGLASAGASLGLPLAAPAAVARVPSTLVISTVKAAKAFAAGQAVAGLVSAPIAALTEGVLKNMLLTKLRIATALLLVAGIAGGGAAGIVYRATAAEASDPKRESQEPAKTDSKERSAKRRPKEVENELQKKLSLPVNLHFADAPLRQVLDDLRTSSGLNIFVSRRTLDSHGLSLDTPVTAKLENVSLRTALNLILNDAGMDYTVRDGIIIVTAPSAKLMQRVYQVADLVVPTREGKRKEDKLIQLITKVIEPESWDSRGGAGTIEFFPLSTSLVVNQTAEVHEQIQQLLKALREFRDDGDKK